MYLNLDLLYVLDAFTFPLFYYSNGSCFEVYCPINLKSVKFGSSGYTFYCDFITSKMKSDDRIFEFESNRMYSVHNARYFLKSCNLFKIKEKEYLFLKSNKRIK